MSNTHTMADSELIRAYLEGKYDAFDELLARHQDRVFRHILYAVGEEDPANDIFQETFVKVILSLQQGAYTERGQFGAWLMRIAHNLVLDHFKCRRKGDVREDERVLTDDANESGHVLCHEEEMMRQESIEQVKRWITQLPVEQRKVVIMRFYEEVSFKEIAERTGVSISTALARMRYALHNLRKMADAERVLPVAL